MDSVRTTPRTPRYTAPAKSNAFAAAATGRDVAFPRPKPSFALMALLGHLNRWLMLRRRFRVQEIEFPAADRERLVRATRPDTAAFLAPNHPEFGFDWMLDKEISRIVAPRMAAWAAHDIIATAPWFWTRINLVSNRGGEKALEYSIEWARRGGVVLLHPEGMVHWTSDLVHPLFGGTAEMALSAAQRDGAAGGTRSTFIVPIVWKARYTSDVSAAVVAEMAHIERSLGLERGDGASIGERFRRLHEGLLARQTARFGFAARVKDSRDYFDRQDGFRAWLVDGLLSRHRVDPSGSLDQIIHRLAKVVVQADDRARVREAMRLGGFSRACYDGPTLTQEHMHECLKRIRADLVHGGIRNALHNALPKPYGPRVVHVRVPEPIRVFAPSSDADRPSCVMALLSDLRRSMQATLDAINREIAPLVAPLQHPNLLYAG